MTKRDLLKLIGSCPDDMEIMVWGEDGLLHHDLRTSLLFGSSGGGCILITNKHNKNDETRTFRDDQRPTR